MSSPRAASSTDCARCSAGDVWAGGAIGDAPGLAHWNGRTWTAVTPAALSGLPPYSYVTSLSASGPGDVWAVGAGGLSVHYDGRAWRKVPLPSVGGDEIWLEGVRTDPVVGTWAVGYRVGADHVRHSLALHAVGGAWQQVSLPDAAYTQLEDVAFTPAGPVAFGYVDSATTAAAYGVTLPLGSSGRGREVAAPAGLRCQRRVGRTGGHERARGGHRAVRRVGLPAVRRADRVALLTRGGAAVAEPQVTCRLPSGRGFPHGQPEAGTVTVARTVPCRSKAVTVVSGREPEASGGGVAG